MPSMRTRARLRGRGKSAPATGARAGRPVLSVDALPYNPADVTYALANAFYVYYAQRRNRKTVRIRKP